MLKRRRNTLAILLCAVLLIGCVPFGSAAADDDNAPRIIVESTRTKSGGWAHIPVRFENVPALSVLHFTLTYNPRILTPDSYSYKGFGWSMAGGDNDFGDPEYMPPLTREFNFGPVTDFDGTCPEEYFLDVHCKVAENAALGELPILFNLLTAKDLDGNDVSIEIQNGTVTIISPQITVGSGSARAGQTLEVPLYFEQTSAMSSFHFNVTFDPRVLEPTDYTYEYDQVDGSFLRDTQPFGGDPDMPYIPTSETAGVHYDGTVQAVGEKTALFTLRFRVLDGAAAGDTNIAIRIVQAKDYPRGENDLTMETFDGVWTVTPRVAGDPDGDGEVTLRDVTNLIRYLSGSTGANTDVSSADVNGDGLVTLKDVTLLRRYLAGGWDVELI